MTATPDRPVLSVRELSVRYRTPLGDVAAVDDVSFDARSGQTVALIGESGSGKSTTALAVLGLLPGSARITGGTALLHDADATTTTDLLTLRAKRLRRLRWSQIAYVSQGSISAFNPVLTIATHFRHTAAAHGRRERSLDSRALELIAAMRLEPGRVWSAYPHELSGGTRQRVSIALAMLLQPRLIILDEPTTALDVLTQRAVLEILKELQRATAVGYVLVTHDLSVAASLADTIATMYAGRIVERAAGRSFVGTPLHPYSKGLLGALPDIHGDTVASAVRGGPPNLLELPAGCPFHPRCPEATSACRRGAPPPLEELLPDHTAACLVRAAQLGPGRARPVSPDHRVSS